jgi:transcriptional regulator with XRE-family HTH domain
MTLGDLFREIRRDLKMQQVEFAEKLGIKQPHLSKIENNFSDPPSSALVAMMRLTNSRAVYLRSRERISRYIAEGS